MSPALTLRVVESGRATFVLLLETEAVYEQWLRMLSKEPAHGRTVHDLRLVAAAMAHQLDHVLTFDTRHFARFSEISAIHPSKI